MSSPKPIPVRKLKLPPPPRKPLTLVALSGGFILVLLLLASAFLLKREDPAPEALQTDALQTDALQPEALPLEISVEDAFAKREAGAFVLDVRNQQEWNEVHVPGSTHIPLGQLADRVSEVPQDQEIVVVCRAGNRSRQGRDILLEAGFSQVASMAGGLERWQSAGYPIVTGP